MELDDDALTSAVRRLHEVLPLAREDAAARRGRVLPPAPELVEAAEALAAGGGLALVLRREAGGWTAEALIDAPDGEAPLVISTPPTEAASEAAALAAGREMLAGLLMLARRAEAEDAAGARGFLLAGLVVPLDAALPSAAAGADEAAARRHLDQVIAGDFPQGVTRNAIEEADGERKRRLLDAVHRLAALGLFRHP